MTTSAFPDGFDRQNLRKYLLSEARWRMQSQTQTTHPLITFSCGAEQLSIVRMDDGTCGIERNGRLVSGCAWPDDRADECAARYARLVMMRLAHEMNGSTLPVGLPQHFGDA